jgi:ectoine hydroxylase-related dioxygenase (phytanoyl-CoA dioxygenase family)
MMHPHRVSDVAMRYMLHPAFGTELKVLLGEEAIAAQSMFYWKPPTARGQAFHQDNFYLKVHPGTCVAAWVALDEIDEENGCLFVAPGSHKLDIYCPEEADTRVSFTTHYVPVPEGLEQRAVRMHPGDVLFFGGNLIHGSFPNGSATRFRRSFICHYAGESAEELSKYYFPLYSMRGDVVTREVSTDGGPCGTEAKGPH